MPPIRYTSHMPFDIGVGIFISLTVSRIFGVSLTPMLILICISAALLPDIDLVTVLWGRWRHRELTHYPIVYGPLIFFIHVLAGPLYATIAFLGVFIHLIHDTVGIGWGVSWFWPLTNRRFLFFPEKGRRTRYGWFMTWLPENQYKIIEEPSSQHWIVRYYLRPNTLGAIEYGFLRAQHYRLAHAYSLARLRYTFFYETI